MNHMFQEAGATMESLKPRMKDLQDGITQLDALFKDQIVQNVQVRKEHSGFKLIADKYHSNRRTLSLTDLTTQGSCKCYWPCWLGWRRSRIATWQLLTGLLYKRFLYE